MRRMYSENQIAEIVKKNPQAVVKALEGQDITGKTLKQSEANWVGEFEFTDSNFPEGIEVTNIFNKLIEINNVLYLICNLKLHNTSESAISISSFNKNIVLPKNIAEKIYDYGGAKVSEAQPTLSYRDITTDIGFSGINNIVAGTQKVLYLRHTDVNTINIEVPYGITIQPNNYNAFTSRTFLILL